MAELLIATRNEGKAREFDRLLNGLELHVRTLADLDIDTEIPEAGTTFADNAAIKAAGYSALSGTYAIADDSGLEIAALDGWPGVLSARFGGKDTPYCKKNAMILDLLKDAVDRRAQFVSCIAFAGPTAEIIYESRGVCEGSISFEIRGTNGFGYDPIFIPDGFDLTFGELTDDLKGKISHRARAISKIIPKIRVFFHNSLDPRNLRL